ncbi:MAG: hypothetical protein ACLRWQ_21980 [Flavonifractor plautii]
MGLDGPAVTSAHGVTVTADLTLDRGGPGGRWRCWCSPAVWGAWRSIQRRPASPQALIQQAYDRGCWLAAICAAPTILAHMGCLDRPQGGVLPRHGGAGMGSAVVQKGSPVVADGQHHHRRGRRLCLPLRPEAGGGARGARRPPGRSAMPSTTTAEKAELRRRARQYLSGLSPQARRTSDDALFAPLSGPAPGGGGGYPAALPRHGASPTPPACSPRSGRGARRFCSAPLPAGPRHGGPACPAGQRADPPPLCGCWSRGRTAPGGARDAIGLGAGARSVPSTVRRAVWARAGGYYDRWLADYAGCTAALCRTSGC